MSAGRAITDHDRSSPGAVVEIELCEGADALDDTDRRWSALAADLGCSPFLRPRWFQLWWRSFGAGTPVVLRAQRADVLVGVLPLVRRRGVVVSMSNSHSPIFDGLAVDEDVAEALWSEAIELGRRHVDVVALRGGMGAASLRAAATAASVDAWVRHETAVPYVDVAGTTWDAYDDGLSKKFRKDLARQRRRLEEDAPVDLRWAVGDQVVPAFERAMEIEASGWKGDRGTAMRQAAATRRFYRSFVEWGADEGWLRIAELRHDDRVISFQLIVQHDGVWYPVKVGYDDEYSRRSPGMLTLYDVLAAAFDAGIDRYDFAGAMTPALERWADGTEPSLRIDVFKPVLGLPDRAALKVARPAAKRLRHVLRSGVRRLRR